jgi:glycosyltransferase involved in cell wall biosynthesis
MIARGVLPDKGTTVLYDGFDLAEAAWGERDRSAVRTELGIRPDQILVGIVGRVEYWKGHLDFVQAAAIVDDPKIRWVVVGDNRLCSDITYYDRVMNVAHSLSLDRRLQFTGYRDDVNRIMGALDILVVPSENEPLGRVAVEAMAAGKPVVAADSGGLPEIVISSVTGELFPLHQPDKLAACVCRLAKCPDLRSQYGTAGRERVARLFGIDLQLQHLDDVYNGLLLATR